MDNHANNPAGGVKSPSAPALQKRIIRIGNICLGVSEGNSLTLTGTDQNGSLLWSRNINSCKGTVHSWSPYGSAQPADASLPGFNGERIDPVSGTYRLGNGYRTYNPVLMRFNSPDSLSPFGAGGINPYAYCAGDPVNHTDHSGHLSWQAILGITLGAIGLAAAVFTGGMSIAAAGGVAAALGSASATALVVGSLGIVADVTAIASGAVEDSDPAASSVLGWVSLATGLPGAVAGLAGLGKSIKGAIKGKESYNLAKAAGKTRKPVMVAMFNTEKNAVPSSSRLPPRQLQPQADESLFIKVFEAEARRDQNDQFLGFMHTGYISNFRTTGEPGLLVHGNPSTLSDEIITNGIPQIKFFHNMADVVEHIFQKYNIDLIAATQRKKLHLLTCHATGPTGTAQRLANVIKSPVVSYGPPGSKIFSPSIGELIWATPHNRITIKNRYGVRVDAEPYIHYPAIFH